MKIKYIYIYINILFFCSWNLKFKGKLNCTIQYYAVNFQSCYQWTLVSSFLCYYIQACPKCLFVLFAVIYISMGSKDYLEGSGNTPLFRNNTSSLDCVHNEPRHIRSQANPQGYMLLYDFGILQIEYYIAVPTKTLLALYNRPDQYNAQFRQPLIISNMFVTVPIYV